MAYGITNESQLIDINTITNGINKFKEAVEDFEKCGKKVVTASEICNADALSVDSDTLQYPIESLGLEIQKLKDELNTIANELLFEAQMIRQQQYNELAEYKRQQAQKQNQTSP